PADSGTPDTTDRTDHSGCDRSGRRWCNLRSPPSVHDDAWRREAALRSSHQRHARRLPGLQGNSRRVLVAGQSSDQRRVTPASDHHRCKISIANRWSAVALRAGTASPRTWWTGPEVTLLGSPPRDGRWLSYADPSTGALAIRDLAGGSLRCASQA